MHRIALALTVLVLLTGCTTTHEFYLVARGSGAIGSGTVPANGRHGGPISITLGEKVFEGRWVYVQAGGSAGFATATAISGTHSANASGVFLGLPTGGNGTVIATAADRSTLRCTFYFSEWDLRGAGVCQDNKGETYDLQIT